MQLHEILFLLKAFLKDSTVSLLQRLITRLVFVHLKPGLQSRCWSRNELEVFGWSHLLTTLRVGVKDFGKVGVGVEHFTTDSTTLPKNNINIGPIIMVNTCDETTVFRYVQFCLNF